MKTKLFQNKIYVKKSPTHGYGVFAGKKIRKGEIIEQCYAIITKGKDRGLEDYYFDANGKYAVLTGYGVIYNHSDDNNADHDINLKTRIATITANSSIKKNEEILVSYGDEWFDSRGMKPKHVSSEEVAKKNKRKKRHSKK